MGVLRKRCKSYGCGGNAAKWVNRKTPILSQACSALKTKKFRPKTDYTWGVAASMEKVCWQHTCSNAILLPCWIGYNVEEKPPTIWNLCLLVFKTTNLPRGGNPEGRFEAILGHPDVVSKPRLQIQILSDQNPGRTRTLLKGPEVLKGMPSISRWIVLMSVWPNGKSSDAQY